MKDIGLIRDEMNVYGYSFLGDVLSAKQVEWFKHDLLTRKQEHIEQFGEASLREKGEYDVLRALIRFDTPYIDLVTSTWLNDVVNVLLNEKAIILDYYGVFNTDRGNTKLARYRFHRDQPWIKETRASFLIFLPLVDVTEENGATLVVPSTHLFEKMPGERFISAHQVSLVAPAGSAVAMDAALWHSSGFNTTNKPRPMIAMRYQLAYMKVPLDLCEVYKDELPGAPDLVKRRLGWYCRSNTSRVDTFGEEARWQSGNYDMENTSLVL